MELRLRPPEPATSTSGGSQPYDVMLRVALEGLRSQQNLAGGVLAGFGAAVAGGVAWGAVSVVTGYQIGFMAIGVGYLVAYAVRVVGKGLDKVFGVVGAVLALVGCLLGNLLTVVYYVSDSAGLGYFETLARLDPAAVPELIVDTFAVMDILFYGLAVYTGYKYAFRQVDPRELERASTGVSVASPSVRG